MDQGERSTGEQSDGATMPGAASTDGTRAGVSHRVDALSTPGEASGEPDPQSGGTDRELAGEPDARPSGERSTAGGGSAPEAEHPTVRVRPVQPPASAPGPADTEERTPAGENFDGQIEFEPWADAYGAEEPQGRRALTEIEESAWLDDQSSPDPAAGPTRAEWGQPGADPTFETSDLVHLLQPTPPPRSRLGWRALFHLPPSKQEVKEFAQQEMLRAQFARPVTLMVANPKGGTGKTPISLVLAGEFGEARGGGVVVFDNNENRGTAAQRSYFSHNRTVADLLEYADELDKPEAQFTDLAYFLAHQNSGKYYVLASDESVTRQVDEELFARVHRILSRFFAVIIIDSGNNELASNWLAGLDVADGLVVPTQWRQDHVVTANKMLRTLREREHPILERTMIIGTNAPAAEQPGPRQAAFEWFQGRHHLPVMEIPTDAHIHEGGVVDRSKLTNKTRRAALAAAAVASGLIVEVADQPRYPADEDPG